VRKIFVPLFVAIASVAFSQERIVVLGSTVAEITTRLGATGQVVGADASVTAPELAAVPKVGYYRQIPAEGILSLRPTLILASSDLGPASTVEQLKAAGTRLELVKIGHSPDETLAAITRVGDVLGRGEKAAELAAEVREDLAEVKEKVAASASKPRVVFVYARSGGVLNVGGRGTAADAMISLAGGENAVTGFDGFRPLTPESLVAANPDVILFTTSGLEGLGGPEGAAKLPAIAPTNAAKSGRIVAMNDQLLLGFGPRLGDGVLELHGLLHPTPAEKPAQ